MIKKMLLRIAYIINKHYQTIEIKHEDLIKYNNYYFKIVSTHFNRKIWYPDTLDIEAKEICDYMEKAIIKK